MSGISVITLFNKAICNTRTRDVDPGPEDPCKTRILVKFNGVCVYLKRTFNEDLAECVNLWSIRGICVFNNRMTFHNNVRHNITSSDHKYFTNFFKQQKSLLIT